MKDFVNYVYVIISFDVYHGKQEYRATYHDKKQAEKHVKKINEVSPWLPVGIAKAPLKDEKEKVV